MNLLNLPDYDIARVEQSARDYRVHATYKPEPDRCIHCGKGVLFGGKLYHHGRGYSFKAIRAKMLYSKGLQKQIRPVRYGGDFVGKMVGCPVDGPKPILGTDVDALLPDPLT